MKVTSLLFFVLLGCHTVVKCTKDHYYPCLLRIERRGPFISDHCSYEEMGYCKNVYCHQNLNEVESCRVRVEIIEEKDRDGTNVGQCHCVCKYDYPNPENCDQDQFFYCRTVCQSKHPHDWMQRMPTCVVPDKGVVHHYDVHCTCELRGGGQNGTGWLLPPDSFNPDGDNPYPKLPDYSQGPYPGQDYQVPAPYPGHDYSQVPYPGHDYEVPQPAPYPGQDYSQGYYSGQDYPANGGYYPPSYDLYNSYG